MCNKSHKRVVITIFLLLITNTAWSLEWRREGGLDVGFSYSDNLIFTSTDVAESGSITNLTPYVGIFATGRNSEFSFEAEGRYQSFSDQSSDSFVPELDAGLSIELVENLLANTLKVSVAQVESDGDAVFEGSIAPFSDTSNQYSGSINSNLIHDFSKFGNVVIDHTYSVIDNSDDLTNDSFDHTSRFTWAQLPGTGRLPGVGGQPGWGLEGRHQRTDFSGLDDFAELYSIFGAFGLFTSREWLLSSGIGQEWTNSRGDEGKSRDDIWNMTLAWRPNAQSSLVLGYGERSFGSNPSFEYTLSGRRSTLSAYWRRDYANTTLISSDVEASNEDTVSLINDQEVTAEVPEHLLLDRQLFVDDEIGMEFQLRGRLSDLALRAVYLVRENRAIRTDVKSALVSASFSRRVTSNISGEIRYTYRELLPSASVESLFENRIQLTFKYSS